MLQRVSTGVGEWTPALEREYRARRARDATWRELLNKPAPDSDRDQAMAGWVRYDALRFARLCAQLRTREPDAMVGYSILIYRVDAAELAQALGTDPSGL